MRIGLDYEHEKVVISATDHSSDASVADINVDVLLDAGTARAMAQQLIACANVLDQNMEEGLLGQKDGTA